MQESIQSLPRPPKSLNSRKEMKSLGSSSKYFYGDQIYNKGSLSSSSSSASSKNGLRSVSKLRNQFSTFSLRLRLEQANKEMLRRALTPPTRRLRKRWLNFKPTPSRLSNMSAS
ncbi:hypothetical protein LIER_17592 [Lithospermum erythrorhizon]|uniref:Uncharacterized protein n=1 Tax=Lithospermum erythrorhizon TaxID=34254 RepID=A0AAV3QB55_LITER